MRVIDGDRDYLEKEEEFIRLYNDEHNYIVKEICKRLDITLNQYRKLRDKCKEDGTIKLRPAYRPRKKKHEPKFYSVAYRNRNKTTFQINKRNVYYCKAHSAREAELIVAKLKECDWDKSQVPRIKEEVKKELKNDRTRKGNC